MTLALKLGRIALVASVLCGGFPAAAQASVSLYIDFINQQDGDTFTMTAHGSAIQDQCEEDPTTDVNVFIFKQPGNNQLAMNSSSGACGAQTSTSYSQALTGWPDGEYEARVTSSGHGCASLSQNITAFTANYRLVQDRGNGKGAYSRCDTGPCLNLTFDTPYSTAPPFIHAFILRVSWGIGIASCFGGNEIAIPSCP